MTLKLNEILNCTSGDLILKGTQEEFDKISIDTRNIKTEDIFLAIKGINFDGNKYIPQAVEKGVKLCIISKVYFDINLLNQNDVSIILVEDTFKALENLAIFVRNKLKAKIIAVTGSVGKTTTKDLIYDFLNTKYKVYKNFGNYNNHLGMPLSLINIENDSEIGIFELGMSNIGEIDYLAKILSPDIGVITNIGVSHIEYLKTRENIFKAKMEIANYFNKDSILILNNEDEFLKCVNSSEYNIYKVGFSNTCNMYANNIELYKDGVNFNLMYNGEIQEVSLSLLGKHNVLNSLIAFKICSIFKIPFDSLKEKFKSFTISSMRQEIINHNKLIIINDCYNASPNSMKSSIDILNLYKGDKVCIFGDMKELGEESKYYHKNVSEYANSKVDKLISIGSHRYDYCEGFENKNNCYCFENIDEFEKNMNNILNGMEVILVKASRSEKFERIIKILMDKF